MPQNEAFHAGTRYYACAGDWALGDLTTLTEHTVSCANASGSVPSSAVVVALRGRVVFTATGTAGTVHDLVINSYSISGNSNSELEELHFTIIEPDGLSLGAVAGSLPFRVNAYITNHVTDPEFILNLSKAAAATAGEIQDLAVMGYWLP